MCALRAVCRGPRPIDRYSVRQGACGVLDPPATAQLAFFSSLSTYSCTNSSHFLPSSVRSSRNRFFDTKVSSTLLFVSSRVCARRGSSHPGKGVLFYICPASAKYAARSPPSPCLGLSAGRPATALRFCLPELGPPSAVIACRTIGTPRCDCLQALRHLRPSHPVSALRLLRCALLPPRSPCWAHRRQVAMPQLALRDDLLILHLDCRCCHLT